MHTDFTDPSTVDVDEVIANISHDYLMRGDCWTDRLSWPNVTVKALADEVMLLREEETRLRDGIRWALGSPDECWDRLYDVVHPVSEDDSDG